MESSKERITSNEERVENDNSIAIGMGSFFTVQKEGEAISQIVQAYEGVRYDSSGLDLKHKGRSLKKIKEYKINENFAERNIKQQAGFDAELIDEARRNKANIRAGKNERVRTSDGIGRTNDMQYDHLILDSNQKIIEGSGSQMKFYGTKEKNGRLTYRVIDKIATDNSWSRYDTRIDIPTEQYEGAKQYAEQEAKALRKQAEYLKSKNYTEKAQLLERKAEAYESASKTIRKSTVSSDEAIKARLNPELFVAGEVLQDINHAGIETAKGAMIASSAIYTAQGLYALISNDKSSGEVVADISLNLVKTGVVGYGMGVVETSLKTVMHSSKKELIRRCGNTSLPMAIATGIVEVTRSLSKFADGKISEEELLQELGEKGVGMMASGYGATVGAVAGGAMGSLIPIVGNVLGATVGSFIGSMVGYTVSSVLYNGVFQTLKMEKISERRRILLKQIEAEAIRINNFYIDELDVYLVNCQSTFRIKIWDEILTMKECIRLGDEKKYVKIIEKFGELFNLKLSYKTFEDFDLAMKNYEYIIF